MIFGPHCSFTVIILVRLILFTVARYLISGLISMVLYFMPLSNVCRNGQHYAKHRKTMSSYKSTFHKDMILIIQLRWIYFPVNNTLKQCLIKVLLDPIVSLTFPPSFWSFKLKNVYVNGVCSIERMTILKTYLLSIKMLFYF